MSVERAALPTLAAMPGQSGKDQFREVMRCHTAGVAVVTAMAPSGPVGLTATSFVSVSLEPPLVSFCVADTSQTLPGLRAADGFAVHLLGAEQADLAARFAAKDGDRFAPPTSWCRGPGGVPILEGAEALLVCRRYETIRVGDHLLLVGEVVDAGSYCGSGTPLVYYQGTFGTFLRAGSLTRSGADRSGHLPERGGEEG